MTTTAGYNSSYPVNAWGSGTLPQSIFTPARGTTMATAAKPAPTPSRLNTAPGRVDHLYQKAAKEKKYNNTTLYIKDNNIRDVRYSQDSVAHKTRDGITLEHLTNNIIVEGWKGEITVVKMPDGRFTSEDNRRLVAAKRAYQRVATPTAGTSKVSSTADRHLTIVANAFDHSVRASDKDLDYYRFAYQQNMDQLYPDYYRDYDLEEIPLPDLSYFSSELKENTQGELVILRMNSGQGDTEAERLGFNSTPFIRQPRYDK